MLLTGCTFEALQVVNFVPNAHRHLKRSDPLLAGSAETVLAKQPEDETNMSSGEEEKLHRTQSLMSGITHQPEVVSPTQLSSQLVVKAAPHLPESAATQVAAQAVLMPVLLNGLQEEPVADALLAAATGEQRWRHLQDLVHWLPVQRLVRKANLGKQFSQVQSVRAVIKSAAEQIKPSDLDAELVVNLWPAQKCIF